MVAVVANHHWWDPSWRWAADAYWRGVQDGRKLDRARAYALGRERFRRELRDVLGLRR